MGRELCLLVVVLAGCVEANLVPCADGRDCPGGTICDEVHHGCVRPEQVSSCEGLAEQEACLDDGRCFDGICLPAGCGNGFLEIEELCDDGNATAGDGCAADCRSREVCGDGFVDGNRGELCDDGATRGADGCNSVCRVEDLVWRRIGGVPEVRMSSAVAYDAHRRRLVMFGGGDVLYPLGDTWEWDGATWTDVTPPLSPSLRAGHALAYDPDRRRVVLFGGTDGFFSHKNDTWEWDGLTWARKPTAVTPTSRYGHAMAWDPIRHQLVLFGGSASFVNLDDTWAWDGEAWTPIVSAVSPPPRYDAELVFDAAAERLVLHGGRASAPYADTWILGAAGWSRLDMASDPPTFISSTAAYDPVRGVIVLVGMISDVEPQTWELVGATWQRVLDNPPALNGAAAAFDLERRRIVLFAGRDGSATDTNSIVERDGLTWTTRAASTPPPVRTESTLAYDPRRGRAVLFGGVRPVFFSDPEFRGDTWEWDGHAWRAPVTTVSPAPRADHAMAYDAPSRAVLLFGGGDDSQVFGDTWLWDGQQWSPRVVSPAPSARRGAGAVYDIKRGRIVMFGGRSSTNTLLDDTWAWDGSSWTELSGAARPPGRWMAALTYDAARDRMVLFGGAALSGPVLADTWEWDGVAWLQRQPIISPPGRERASLVFDPARQRCILFGGKMVDFSAWEWDGDGWTQPIVGVQPSSRSEIATTYDVASGEIVAFGGRTLLGSDETWIARYRSGDDEACLSGIDRDGDAVVGCADDECTGRCEPMCVRGQPCDPGLPRCGDGACGPVENERLCPQDCTATPICGDAFCAAQEVCAADC